MAGQKITELDALVSVDGSDLLAIVDDPGGTPITKKITVDDLLAAVPPGTSTVVQVKNVQTGTRATGTTVIPIDNTIPQNTEGDEYMTLAITPTNAANKLKIDVVIFLTTNTTNWMTVGLFQDSTANALAAFTNLNGLAGGATSSTFTHYMTAGTTSATTFKVRAGASGANTTVFNGDASIQFLGGVLASSITITEIVP